VLDTAHSRPCAGTRIRLAAHGVAAQAGASAVEEGFFHAEIPLSFHLGALDRCQRAFPDRARRQELLEIFRRRAEPEP